MGLKFWLKRFIKLFLGIAVLLFIVEIIKQHTIENALIFAMTWSFISTSIFIVTRVYYSNKGVDCSLCNDTLKSESKTHKR